MSMVLVCEMCGTQLGTFEPDALAMPLAGSMFGPLGPGFAPPFDPAATWEFLLCPLCHKRAMGWDMSASDLLRPDRLLTTDGYWIVGRGLEAQNVRTGWEAEHPEQADVNAYRNSVLADPQSAKRFGELVAGGASEEDALRQVVGEGAKAGEQAMRNTGQTLEKAMPEDERYAGGKSSGMLEGAVRGTTEFAPSLVASAVNPILGLVTTTGQLAGGHYEQFKGEGAEPARAAQAAYGSAAVEAPLFAATNLFNVGVLGKVFGKNPLSLKFTQAMAGANSAGAVGALSTIPQEVASTWSKNPDMTLKDAVDAAGENLHDTIDKGNVQPGLLSKMGEAYLANALGAGLMHGVGLTLGKGAELVRGQSPAERAATVQKLYVADMLNTPGEVEKFIQSASPAEMQQVYGIAQDIAANMPKSAERFSHLWDISTGRSARKLLKGQGGPEVTPFTEGLLKLDQAMKGQAEKPEGVPYYGPEQTALPESPGETPPLTRKDLAEMATGNLDAQDHLMEIADSYGIKDPHKMESTDLVDNIMSAQAEQQDHARHTKAMADMQAQAEQARNDILAAQDEAGRLDAIKRFEDATKSLAQMPALPEGQGFSLVGEPTPRTMTPAQREQMARQVMQPEPDVSGMPQPEGPAAPAQAHPEPFARENEEAFEPSQGQQQTPTPNDFARTYGIPETPEFLEAIRQYQEITGEGHTQEPAPVDARPDTQNLDLQRRGVEAEIRAAEARGEQPDPELLAERDSVNRQLAGEPQPQPAEPQGRTVLDGEQFPDALFHRTGQEGRDAQGRLLAPNGQPSNLGEEQHQAVRSVPFRRWAGHWDYDPQKQVPVVEVNPSAMAGVDLKNARSISHWLKENLAGSDPVTVKSTGEEVGFTRSNLNASLKRRGDSQRQAYAGLRDLLANAEYFDFEPADAKHAVNLDGQDVYFSSMRIGGKDYAVKIKVDVAREDKAQTYKDHKVSEIQIAPVVSPAHSPEGKASGTTESLARLSGAIRSYNIDTLTGGVKPRSTSIPLDANGEPLSASLSSDGAFRKSLSARGIPAQTVEEWLSPVRDRLAEHINLQVANTPNDIPAADRARMRASDPNWAQNSIGWGSKDASYVFAWNLKGDKSEVQALAAHEVKHQAVYRIFERLAEEKPYNGMAAQQMAKVLNPLVEARRGEIETLMRGQYGKDFNPSNRLHMLVGASEWLADAKNVEPKLYEKFMAAIRAALRSVGEKLDIYWLKDMKMSDAEIHAFNARVMREALRPDVPVSDMPSYEELNQRQAAGGEQKPVDLDSPELASAFRRGTATIPRELTQADHNIAFDAKPRTDWSKEGIKKTLSGLYDKFINQDQPWVRYAEMAGPEQAKAMNERTARLRGLGGITNESLSGEGVPTFWKTGHETESSGIKPLSSILEQIKSPEEYKNYEILRKGERMLALAKYRPEFTPERAAEMKAAIADIREMYGDSPTPREIREMKQLIQDTKDYYQNGVKGVDAALWRRNLDTLWAQIGPEEYSRLQKISGEHRQWERDAILKPLMESGVMSREKYDAILNAPENEYYASFQREMDNVDRQVLGTREVVKRLKGSDLATIPSTESTIANFTRTVRAIETNARNKQFVDLRELSDDLGQVIQPIKANPEHPPRDALIVYENGVKKYYSAPGDIVKAAQGMTPQETHLAMRVLQWPAKALRAGATLTAEFMARNPIRDQMTAYLFSKYGYVPVVDFVKGFNHILGNSEIYREYRASGAEQAYFTALDRQFAGKTAKELTGYGSNGAIKYLKNPLEALRWLNEWSEKATRVGGYAKAREMGANPMQAMQEARDLTLDFGRMGSQGKVLNSIIAFWNANVQDVDKMRRAFKEQPGTTMARMVMGVTLPSLALWMLNKDEDWYKELPEWRKNMFWNFKIGDSPVLSLPKPFLPGILFGSLPERILDYAYLNDKKAIPSAIKDAAGSAMPGLIPTAGLPVLEWMTNHSFFRDAPIENAGAQRLPAGYRANAGTSKLLAEIGKMTDISPLKMENTIRDVFGGLGGYGLTAADWLTKAATGNDVPEVGKHWYEQTPLVRGFVAREPMGSASKSVDDFYDNYEKTAQAKAGFVALQKSDNAEEARKYFESNKDDIAISTAMANGARILSNIRKALAAIQRNKDMSAEEKRMQVDELSRRQTGIASRLNTAYEERTR